MDMQGASRYLPQLDDRIARLLHFAEDALDPLQVELSGIGQGNVPARPVEQLYAERILERVQRAGYRRRGTSQLASRRRQATRLDDPRQELHFLQRFHVHPRLPRGFSAGDAVTASAYRVRDRPRFAFPYRLARL